MSDVDKQAGARESRFGQFDPRGWKWLEWNEVRWSEGTENVCKIFLVQAWSVGVDLAEWKG